MPHPLVVQLRFARSEFVRGLGDVSAEDGIQRVGRMNSISWMVGHLAAQEQRYWLMGAQEYCLYQEVQDTFASGQPAAVPVLDEIWGRWRAITAAADLWLDALTPERVAAPLVPNYSGKVGTFLLRNIYHYWYHLGEAMAVRQSLGQESLADFVGDLDTQAPYQPQ